MLEQIKDIRVLLFILIADCLSAIDGEPGNLESKENLRDYIKNAKKLTDGLKGGQILSCICDKPNLVQEQGLKPTGDETYIETYICKSCNRTIHITHYKGR